jgi:TonB family protein
MWVAIGLLAMAQAASGMPAAPPPVTAAPPDSPAVAAAKANRARMRTSPQIVTAVEPDYPDAERAANHGGTAMVRGILGVDGKMRETLVSRSSGFAALDAAALAAVQASLFSPAKDAAGVAIEVLISVPQLFDPTDLHAVVLTRGDPGYPEAERAAGHHGKVEIGGMLGPDGRMVDAKVTVSSRAPGLDAAALAAARATLFRVRRDAAGKPLLGPVKLNFGFDSYHSAGEGGGILRYRCDQFVLDATWWKTAWPAKEHDAFFTMMLGLRTVMQMSGGRFDAAALRGTVSDMEQRWDKAIEACRASPTALFIDVFKPEGDWARRLAEKKML